VTEAARDSIRWYPRVTVARYSAEQTWWAQRRLGKLHLHGDVLRKLFPRGPEDGYALDEGNSMVNGGLTNLISLLTGSTPSGSAGRPLSLGLGGGASGSACIGVGTDGTTAFAATQTHLANASGESGTHSWYQSMDTGYPTLTTPGTINGQSTFQAGDANFAWNEWCFLSGAGVPTAGATLASVYATAGSGAMLNRKIPAGGLGMKASGAAWVFACSVVFSLCNTP
jgi:hypothetical protein